MPKMKKEEFWGHVRASGSCGLCARLGLECKSEQYVKLDCDQTLRKFYEEETEE